MYGCGGELTGGVVTTVNGSADDVYKTCCETLEKRGHENVNRILGVHRYEFAQDGVTFFVEVREPKNGDIWCEVTVGTTGRWDRAKELMNSLLEAQGFAGREFEPLADSK